MQKGPGNKSHKTLLNIAAMLIPLTLIMLVGWWVERTENLRYVQTQRTHVIEKLSIIRAKLEGALVSELFLAQSLVSAIKLNSDIDQDGFFTVASGFFGKSRHMRNLALARGTVIEFVYPLKGNEAAIGADYTKIPDQWAGVKKAIEERRTIIAGPLNLVQGGIGLIGRLPIFIKDPSAPDAEAQYFGLVAVVLDVPSLLRHAGIMDEKLPLEIALRGRDGLGDTGEVFYGPKELFERDAAKQEVSFFENTWVMAAAPIHGWPESSPQTLHIRLTTLVAALVLGLLMMMKNREFRLRLKSEEEKRQLEESLRQSQKMEAVGTLAGGIAHDFNNILTAILGYTELTLRQLPADSPLRENLETVLEASKRARELTKQILIFSRKGSQTFEPAKIDESVNEAMKLLQKTIPSTVTIKMDISQDTGWVLVNKTEVHQIVINLCTNALHSLKNENGVIGIQLEARKVDASEASRLPNLREGDFAVLSVNDDGDGMDEETRCRIFEPFFTTKGQGKGTGMGLAVVHGIVQAHGGAINVESSLGAGTTFKIFLPLTDAPAKPGEQKEQEKLPGGKERILLVDDEPHIAKLGQNFLTPLGYQVSSFTSVKKALNAFKNEPDAFDLIISDQTMPEMPGDLFAQEAMRIKPSIVVIISTGHSTVIDAEKAMAMGIKAFLTKPWDLKKLAETVRQVLDGEESKHS